VRGLQLVEVAVDLGQRAVVPRHLALRARALLQQLLLEPAQLGAHRLLLLRARARGRARARARVGVGVRVRAGVGVRARARVRGKG